MFVDMRSGQTQTCEHMILEFSEKRIWKTLIEDSLRHKVKLVSYGKVKRNFWLTKFKKKPRQILQDFQYNLKAFIAATNKFDLGRIVLTAKSPSQYLQS